MEEVLEHEEGFMLYRPQPTPRQAEAAQTLLKARENLSRHARADTGIDLSRPKGWRPSRNDPPPGWISFTPPRKTEPSVAQPRPFTPSRLQMVEALLQATTDLYPREILGVRDCSQTKPVLRVRNLIFYLLKNEPGVRMKYDAIGAAFGWSECAVGAGVRQVRAALERDPSVLRELEALRQAAYAKLSLLRTETRPG